VSDANRRRYRIVEGDQGAIGADDHQRHVAFFGDEAVCIGDSSGGAVPSAADEWSRYEGDACSMDLMSGRQVVERYGECVADQAAAMGGAGDVRADAECHVCVAQGHGVYEAVLV
jgi:hypothetical protein